MATATSPATGRRLGARRRARVLGRAVRRLPGHALRDRGARSPRATRSPSSGRPSARSPARALPGHRADRRAARHRGPRPASPSRDGLIVAPRRLQRRHDVRPADRALPPQARHAERGMTRAFNGHAKVAARFCATPERIADGVWLVRGGFPLKTMNVYLIQDGGRRDDVRRRHRRWRAASPPAAAALGGLNAIVLGHAHGDHRGAAPGLGVPRLLPPRRPGDAEGDGGRTTSTSRSSSVPARWRSRGCCRSGTAAR